MTLATLLGLAVARLAAQTETKRLRLGDSRRVVIGVIRLSLTVEAVVAVLLTRRLAIGYDERVGRAL